MIVLLLSRSSRTSPFRIEITATSCNMIFHWYIFNANTFAVEWSLHRPSCCSWPPPTKANNAHWCVIHMLNRGIQALVPRLTNLLSPKTQPFLHAEWMCEQQHHLQIPIGEYQVFFEAVLDPLWRWKRKREGWDFFSWDFQGPAISNWLWYPAVCQNDLHWTQRCYSERLSSIWPCEISLRLRSSLLSVL